MALAFEVIKPFSSGSNPDGNTIMKFNSDTQYFEIDYSGAISTDLIKVYEKQLGSSSWDLRERFVIDSSGDGIIKDILGPFRVDGSDVKVEATNSNGGTTYQTDTFGMLKKSSKKIKEFSKIANELFLEGTTHGISRISDRVYLPAITGAVDKIIAEENNAIVTTALNSSTNFTTTNLDVLPIGLQMMIRKNPSKVMFNGVNLQYWDTTANPAAYINKPFFVGAGNVYNFKATGSDNGKDYAEKFLEVLKPMIGKQMYKVKKIDETVNGGNYGDYTNRESDYEAIVNSKVSDLF
jgi:hypothetical protein